ncbi:MAG: dihydrolipoamide acetyltransferase family protein [Methylacidiphilales bacterium]|nr:dihydrolipoamide acetyltransferase family protein [Candidatus Methylacidiphilales bacterium]
MADIIEMPKLSDTMTEGTVVKWLKNVGDKIGSGEVIAEIETDKATMDLEAFDSGVLLKIVAPAGARVACKAPIAVIGEKGENADEALAKAPAPAPSAQAKPAPAAYAHAPVAAPVEVSSPKQETLGGRIKASPLAKKVAAELNVILSSLTGSGPGGRIVKKDVLGAGQNRGGGGGWFHPSGPVAQDGLIPLTNMRRTIARRLQESKQQIPHFYTEMEVDMAACIKLREELNARLEKQPQPAKISFNDFVLKACAQAIRKVPSINSSFGEEAIHQHGSVDLAFGVAIPGGLITPIIRNAQDKNLKQISIEARELAGRAKEGKLNPQEYSGGTFTVSNLGMFGVDWFSAIVNPPQAAILAVGNIVKKPVVNEHDQIVIGYRMSLVLSADHRVVDGADGAKFLTEVKALLEVPGLLLV